MSNPSRITDSVWSDRLTGTGIAETFQLSWGNDSVYAGGGDDFIYDADGHYINGVPGRPGDRISLGSDDLIYAGAGHDTVRGGWGADTIYGGKGQDTLDYRHSKSAVEVNITLGRGYGDENSASRGDVFSGFEAFVGSYNDDRFFLNHQGFTITAGDGNDSLYGGNGNSTIYGGEGDDLYLPEAASGTQNFFGGEGEDLLSLVLLTRGADIRLVDGHGIEQVLGSARGDTVSGFVDRGTTMIVRGEGGNDVLGIGGFGTAQIFGGTGHDRLVGGSNDDSLYGGSGDDALNGWLGNDRLFGASGRDSLNGGEGRDVLFGGSGDDWLTGGGGTGDRLYGGTGNDVFEASDGSVTMFGEGGADHFIFSHGDGMHNGTLRIADFQQGLDVIDISGFDARPGGIFNDPAVAGDQAFVFMGLAGRSAPAGMVDFIHSGNDTIIRLHTDSDGVANYRIVLTGHHTLTVDDFVL